MNFLSIVGLALKPGLQVLEEYKSASIPSKVHAVGK